ncbi:EKC/KEOPS complex, subunit Gon7 [Beauveria brongniartii RCEF 3172]|uniref:EKC/KEOPS complex subunit GON7 n=1 Tax=Beauveria brongniartii RCEF 3172 TaxID=1081107 RepID=A0A167III0_9HYPO|nr:EKC/KEOPS complex, subunit Gon7 [Beauveria brongniartii RCEF 3172]
MSRPATTTANTLTASYTSPTNEAFAITTPLPSSSSSSSPDKTSHLGALRVAVADAQDTINKELTARMEEDKARDASAAGAAAVAIDDAKEEENYGEEVQEGDN